MLRHEIRQFSLNIEGSEQEATVPFTLCSALSELGKINKDDGIPVGYTVEKMSASATVVIEEAPYVSKYNYLRVAGISSSCVLLLNGDEVGRVPGSASRHLFDLGNGLKSGENIFTFVFDDPELDSGIFLAAELLRFNHAIIDGVRITEERDGDAAILNVEVTTVGSTDSCRGVATLISGTGQIYYGGFASGKASIRIADPLFWYPQGLGVQNIYKLTVNLYGEAESEDSMEFKIGLRTLEPTDGNTLSVNGIGFLPMGAVYIPERAWYPDEARKCTAAFITSAAMAGFNSFVLRGDRLPADSFFDLCDVHGISVIYETSKTDDVTLSAISAFSHHPSFVHLDVIGDRDDRIFEKIDWLFPGIACSYIPKEREYFGESSIPSDKVLSSRIPPEDRNLFSKKMEEHSGGECRMMAASTAEKYLYAWTPTDVAYLTRLAQAENTKAEILRRRAAHGKEGRAVFSEISRERLISASSLDWYSGWKALQYYAKGFFSAVTLDAKADGTSVSITAINNRPVAVFGILEYKVIDNQNKLIYKYSEEIDIAEHSSRTVLNHDLSEYVCSHCEDRFVKYSFTEGSTTLSEGTLLFTEPKYFRYINPLIKAEISGADRRYSINLTSEAYAGRVELSFADVDAVFSDNYFDITSDVPVQITFTVTSPVENVKSLKKQLKIKSLYDIGKI